jgi:acetyl esterase/lipase
MLPPPENVPGVVDARTRVVAEDVTIQGPTGPLVLTLHRPIEGSAPLPTLVFLHGGGFTVGDHETERARCIRLAGDGGCLVVSVDYRFAPEHPFAAGLDDCWAGLEWVVAHRRRIGADTRRLGVGGASAGGALAAAMALRARDLGKPALALQLLVHPVIDERRTVIDMWARYLGRPTAGPDAAPRVASLGATDVRGLAPAAFVLGAEDPWSRASLSYASRLHAAGVPVEIHQYAGAAHGFDLLGVHPCDAHALDVQVGAVRRLLG